MSNITFAISVSAALASCAWTSPPKPLRVVVSARDARDAGIGPIQESETPEGKTADRRRDPAPGQQQSEQDLIAEIKRLTSINSAAVPEERRYAVRIAAGTTVLAYVDELLERFPETSFRADALALKLGALADLARVSESHLGALLELTATITKEKPTGRLAEDNAYYAIQAFVLAARHEHMPEDQRLRGTRERYEAFLNEFPRSDRVPVIRASLVRVLLATGEIGRAKDELLRLKKDYPRDQATRRAQGEMFRATAVGHPFSLTLPAPGGRTIRTSDHLGSVVVLHFWATWVEESVEQLLRLLDLYGEYGERGLHLIGVNVDTDRAAMTETVERFKLSWPQYFDGNGFENEALVATGVVKLPTYFVIDRKGTLRGVVSIGELPDTIATLIAEK